MEPISIEPVRHSLAHLLAMSVLELDPEVKLGTGPATDTGFFYDFEFSKGKTFSENDFKTIEKIMRKFAHQKLDFVHEEASEKEARELFKDQPYKLELIEEIVARGEKISLYKTAKFIDLCGGPHVTNTRDIPEGAFKLSRIAGAYWKSNESSPQLTRITGIAFESKEALEKYEWQQEEAKKRDHKKLGVELDIFAFSDLVGSGLPLWTPKGTLMRNLLDEYVWAFRSKHGYEKVEIPHITKKDLYEKSGHWEKFKDELFRITTREGHEFAMKPMNCPHHTQLYARKQWSYRELPQRYANSTMCYRDEQSGELAGLSRARAFTQDDAHVFCQMSQAKKEFLAIWDIVHAFYGTFGFHLRVRISTHDPSTPEKYLGDEARWQTAENMLFEIATEKNADAFRGIGEAAFYGPKLDFMAEDALGREWQVATIQLDLNMPDRFDLFCINEKGERERIVMIHAAIMGSIERFMSILIEHTGGAFPLWLSPIQVAILPIGEAHEPYAREIAETLRSENFRVEIKTGESLGKRIRETKVGKIPYTLVIGDQEVAVKTATVESRDSGKLGVLSIEEILIRLKEAREKRV